jgi:DNA-binding NarL/FixJ family response regulator
MTRRTSVVLVDDHPVVRDGLAFLLGEQPDFDVVGEAGDPASAIDVIGRRPPALVVLDLSLQGQEALPLLAQIRRGWPGTRILVLSMHDEDLYAERLLALGAHGYVMKQEEPAEFLRALRRVAAGEEYLSPRLARKMLSRPGRAAHTAVGRELTSREHDVLRLVARGLATGEISASLGVSAKTVDSHRRNIREKLGLESARDLVRYAVRWAEDAEGPGSPS